MFGFSALRCGGDIKIGVAHSRRRDPTRPRFTEHIARILKTIMPPKRRRRASDPDDNEGPGQQDILDDDHFKAAQGGVLQTLHWEVEDHLPPARKAERVSARTKLLDETVLPEQVRRMCRRAGIPMYKTYDNARRKSSGTDEEEYTVMRVLKQVCDLYLFNLSFEINRLCEHLKKKTITEELLKTALRSLDLKIAGACFEKHEICKTIKQHRNATGDEESRGTEAEIHHERNNNVTCVYFGYLPFVRLLRFYLAEQRSPPDPPRTRALKTAPGVISCIQSSMESTLIELLEKARYMVRQTTKKLTSDSSPRNTLVARDLRTLLVVLAHRYKILRGRLRALDDPAPPRRRSPSRGSGSPSRGSGPPSRGSGAKATGAPARAKAAARAKRGR